MNGSDPSTLGHYNTLLAHNYLWMAGGFERNLAQNRTFFAARSLTPTAGGIAIDLGAGCGFQSIPLAMAGYSVIAVDFCRPMLDILAEQAGTLPIRPVQADIRAFEKWAGAGPELITCMGDTLTHLPDGEAVQALIQRCAAELLPGGSLIIACRDYSAGPEGGTVVIPVRSDNRKIFLCRLDYGPVRVTVTDILYTQESGTWERVASTYRKIRIAPGVLTGILEDAGFQILQHEIREGIITVTAQKHP
ncbi:MAG: class I SAM-dependent methyltransferase [Methanomicrobiales archaeon]|nr:class I SAM-dependent methyltransferase [Methanomicrobiales archaeon]